jgi:hypothetical protein
MAAISAAFNTRMSRGIAASVDRWGFKYAGIVAVGRLRAGDSTRDGSPAPNCRSSRIDGPPDDGVRTEDARAVGRAEEAGTQFWLLVALTLLSGTAVLKIPTTSVHFSISDVFTLTSAIVFGPAAATVARTGQDDIKLSREIFAAAVKTHSRSVPSSSTEHVRRGCSGSLMSI